MQGQVFRIRAGQSKSGKQPAWGSATRLPKRAVCRLIRAGMDLGCPQRLALPPVICLLAIVEIS
jgi:hypothetical protein